MKKWIAFNFNDPNDENPKEIKPTKRTRANAKNSKVRKQAEDFVNAPNYNVKLNIEKKLAPKEVEDLAVHPKKIQEVERWLMDYVLKKNEEKSKLVSILLIVGPTGSGKTATLKVLCNKLGIEISEWINPLDVDYEVDYGPGQTAKLQDFLRESKYPSLFSTTNSKIALVEDYPNSIIRNPNEFHNILENCQNGSLVFICTDSGSSKLNLPQALFPQEIKDKHNITTITFNPCATTHLKTALKRTQTLLQQYPDMFRTPTPATIEAIIASSMGDIRSAVSQYHFASLKGVADLPTEEQGHQTFGAKRKRQSKSLVVRSMARDESLGLFHCLGRVLNPKREEGPNGWRLQCALDPLVDELSTQPNNIIAFLQENYLQYFGDIEDVCKAAEVLSLSQGLMENWSDRRETLVVGLWVVVLGLMVHNGHRVSKWNQIRGPTKIKRESNQDLKTRSLDVTDYCYYNKITKTSQFKAL